VQLVTDEVGHGYVQGRDRNHAERAAVVDALLQGPRQQEILDQIVTPLVQSQAQRKSEKLRKAAATKVDFFTLVRGED
jgi:alpha-D-ribose 1-methylphosphonate 5-triphosphate synthase subunit PhnG